ncbi:MAG: hypothetical protein A2665_00730 [Candidatus Zambryskibacteria bacterium RIFCSPHIGHO2_01_FULL_46_30]|uniref:Membrane fusion protein biotin-lipoyl like domain-containing protein n=1 Tax=Candidatus Zambryskibacteria bacterium RIFCSPHIGHO2_01_FULL_46_30 TaxID=1802739 RepID=A0A1G2T0G0_9BACT|nr:MAG: hypothetical protein A2665_00730 [Candidatus Zambryskibacteria bacterium RIFCSPHIGHO2_01_FULL_46_30]OHB05257.1 MAG: hypothetical protein A3B22_03175 [Candidatus Zambryskibacteria bacterium RIFCSPLOWO2_01_FULL_47_33]
METILNTFKKVRHYAFGHKSWAIALVGVAALGGYFGAQTFDGGLEIQYVLAAVEKNIIEVKVAGSGQVSATSQIDVKSKTSGEIVWTNAKSGQEIKKGATLFSFDTSDAQKSIRDAELDLESTKLALRLSRTGQSEDIEKQRVAVASAYTKLLNSTFEVVPYDLRDKYTNTDSPTLSGNYTLGKEGDIIIETYESVGGVSYRLFGLTGDGGMVNNITAQPLGNTGLYIKFATDDYTQNGKTWVVHIPNKDAGNYVANLENYENTKSELQRMENQSGTSGIELESKELSVRQKENALLNAKENLRDYYAVAPFDGVIAAVKVKTGETVSANTILGTIITKQKTAEISLNEIDAARAQIGQKASLTFDAIPDLTLTGQVREIDAIGTASQGVVTYNAKIIFDTQDDRVRPGMSVSAEIVAETKTDVLTVPNAALKSQNGSFAEVVDNISPQVSLTANVSAAFLPNLPRRQEVEIGISNDEVTEIKSGLKEGDIVVVRTLQGDQGAQTKPSRPGLFGR